MHQHSVFFWLKDGLSDSELVQFEDGLETLVRTKLVIRGFYGKPADTHRAVVDSSYSYGLHLTFKDLANHNLYQADPIHLAFVDRNSSKWTKVQVFDTETK